MKYLSLIIVVVCLFFKSINTQLKDSKIPVNILLSLPENDTYKFSLNKVLASLNLSILDFKKDVSKFEVKIIPGECDCSATKATFNAMENIYRFRYQNNTQTIQAIFGPMCDYSIAPIARYAIFWGLPVVTVNAMAGDFRKKKKIEYKTLTNIGPSNYWQETFVKRIFEKFGWKKTIMLFDKDYQEKETNSNCFLTMSSLKSALLDNKISVDYKIKEKQDTREYDDLLREYVQNKFSVIMLCGSTQFVYEIMTAAKRQGFNNGEYVFINFDMYAQMHSYNRLHKPWKEILRHINSTQNDYLAYESLLTVTLKVDETGGKFGDFQKRLRTFSNHSFQFDSEVNYFHALFYDAMTVYLTALNRTINENKSIYNVSAVLDSMWNHNFNGITGNIEIDDLGDRNVEFVMYDYDPINKIFEQVITSSFIRNNKTKKIEMVLDTIRPIYWKNKESSLPFNDSPKCGYNNAKCLDSLPVWGWLLIAMSIVMIIIITVGFIFYRRAQFEAELNAMNWLIKWEDVSTSMSKNKRVLSIKYKTNKINNPEHNYLLKNDPEENNSLNNEKADETASLGSIDLRTVNTKVVVYKGNWCFIKKITKTKLEITRSLLIEVKRIKDLQHDHITRFIGISLDPNKQFIFSEYCQKGSLQDLLENQQIELEASFKHHLMHDIIKGMLFLHGSELKYHGNLTSSNCVVDSRFTLKLADFGLTMLHQSTQLDSEEKHYKRQLWKAPEFQIPYNISSYNMNYVSSMATRDQPTTFSHQKGDVFSYAVIVQEILYRKGVYHLTNEDRKKFFTDSDNDLTENSSIEYKEIFKNVKLGLRPSLESDICSKELIDLLKKCWSESIIERPDFTMIRDITRRNTKISGNILDNLLARMEKYANNLEDLVKERTEACELERKRAETLLYRLLPSTVASQLMQGNEVKAESFDNVTIYFSDICGFTDLSANSTPMQVVKLLNGLYTLFDSIIEEFDVYKVETIGDAYMVVSGLPQRNENNACEIARMSLALLDNVEHFKIPHLPEKKLELRIGLHTGPCVAGVVGLKMPRYCLFGDTVNTASRMESNGKALRIHISPQTKEALDKHGTFNIKLRGPVEMKGKGVITTYWLQGENGYIIDRHEN